MSYYEAHLEEPLAYEESSLIFVIINPAPFALGPISWDSLPL